MATAQEIAELVALDREVEKETTRKLRENRTVEFAVRLASYAQQKIDRARDEVVRKGVQFDCRKGCSYCCASFRVDSMPQETFRIARELRSRGDPTPLIGRLADYATKLEGMPAIGPREPCPFLVDHACSIYEVRPMMCRKCNSLDVEKCKTAKEEIPEYPELVYKAGAILHGTVKAYGRNKLVATAHQLVPGVLRALTDPTAEQRWHDGEDVFGAN